MKTAYFDTIAGIAGDMTMAAFVSAGVPFEHLVGELRKLPLEGFELSARHVTRSAVDALHIDVVVNVQPKYHRHLRDILAIVDAGDFAPAVKETAGRIFQTIARAEAAVHNTTIEKVHFHEVGAVDSIVDVVGTAICLEYMKIERVFSSAVRLGSGGFITTQHGVMPVPAPATLEILKDYPVELSRFPYELTTPTGAAIIKTLSLGLLEEDLLTVASIGYGAGTKEFPDLPNFLRVIIGETPAATDRDDLLVVETNIDDMNPQVYPYLIEQLLAAGAHDAYLIPVIMKKGRPGILVSAMVTRPRLDAIVGVITRETTTIGLRVFPVGRRKLARREMTAASSFGPVRVKGVTRGTAEILSPEFEECKRIASERGLPLRDVMRQLEREINQQ